jgi:hypothetical protein
VSRSRLIGIRNLTVVAFRARCALQLLVPVIYRPLTGKRNAALIDCERGVDG